MAASYLKGRKYQSMLRKLVKRMALSQGYLIKNVSKNYQPDKGYVLYDYKKPDGTFDYELYKSIQTQGNKEKINKTWVSEDNIKMLGAYVQKLLKDKPQFGLCHGTRRGNEQKWFKEVLGCDVLGTEISDTAEDFPDTIQWDFHDVKPEWLGAVDFIYSNSFDHSFDPPKCLDAWMSCLKPGGVCILEYTTGHEIADADELDPFGAEITHMPFLIAKWGQGRYSVREILEGEKKFDYVPDVLFFVVQNHDA